MFGKLKEDQKKKKDKSGESPGDEKKQLFDCHLSADSKRPNVYYNNDHTFIPCITNAVCLEHTTNIHPQGNHLQKVHQLKRGYHHTFLPKMAYIISKFK